MENKIKNKGCAYCLDHDFHEYDIINDLKKYKNVVLVFTDSDEEEAPDTSIREAPVWKMVPSNWFTRCPHCGRDLKEPKN